LFSAEVEYDQKEPLVRLIIPGLFVLVRRF
jgi:hypothetical protein